ncbi:Cell division protein [Curtobacterium sp. 314Chir4.1]|uniref:DUF4190 domain-containing protein n=1 Tax=Curtobacterium sp. 314Chir4.1 TaxID=1279028 RepID=UPI000BCF8DBD|nr:DUF4190 domain-containing protein [Curtobacterium sp. 314Chir4.1]SOC89090.1 Cell division protein [Curtobacterium sp. 314Chir4.1]
MSDQNQWPKPGESTPDGGASANQPAPEQGAPSSAAQPEFGQPQQYGASAPEGSSEVPQNPYAAPSNPYAAPGQSGPQGQPGYGAPQNPYAAPQNPYAPPSNPYAAPQQPNANPYGAQQGSNPYAAPAYAPGGYQPYAQRPKTNVLAILSIVFAFGGIIIWPLIILTSPAGAIMGHIALGKIKQSGEGGRGLALAGVIGGWVLTGLFILIVGLFVIIGVAAGTSSNYDYDYDSGAFIG